MILSIATVLLMGWHSPYLTDLQSDQQTQFDKLFPHATGENGLEDYVKAGDLLIDSEFQVFQSWLPPEKRPTPEQERQQAVARQKLLDSMTPEERIAAKRDSYTRTSRDVELSDHLNSLNYLQVKSEEVQRFQRSLDLMIKGNLKPFVYAVAPDAEPGEEDFAVARSARHIARLSSDAAFVAFASGQSTQGAEILDQALLMAHRIGSGNIIERMAADGMMGILFRRFGEHLGALSLSDTKRISKLASELLDDRDGIHAMVRNERIRVELTVERELKTGLFQKASIDEKLPVAQQLKSLTDTQKLEWFNKLNQSIRDRFDTLAQRFDSPEENWLAVKDKDTSDGKDPQTLDQLAEKISTEFTIGVEHEFMVSVLRRRTQLRLLRLHCRILAYRFESGHYPKNLEEMRIDRSEIYDPLSRKPLQYTVEGLSYKAFSAGNQETGQIELNYRVSADQSNRDPDRP